MLAGRPNLRSVRHSLTTPKGKEAFSNRHLAWLPQPCLGGSHLGAVPGLSLSTAAAGNVIILSLDLSHDTVHVQVPAVVHLDDDGGV